MLKELVQKADKIPKGWKTTTEWAKEEKLSEPMVRKYLRLGVQSGIIEKQSFRILSYGMIKPVPHYRIK